MMKFCCTLSNCKRRLVKKKDFCQHLATDPVHNRNLSHASWGSQPDWNKNSTGELLSDMHSEDKIILVLIIITWQQILMISEIEADIPIDNVNRWTIWSNSH